MSTEAVDAVVIGAGHNGLVAANLLADAGWSVLVAEAEKARAMRDRALHAPERTFAAPSAESTAPRDTRSASHGGPRELAAREPSALGEAIAR